MTQAKSVDVKVSDAKKAGKTKMTKNNGHTKKIATLKAMGDATFFGAGRNMGVGDKFVNAYKKQNKIS